MDNNPIVIDPNTQIEVIRSLADKLKDYYIYPDIAENIHGQLNKHLEQGDYSDITEGDLFALALTLHM
jgi:hypothetical protein